MGFCTAAVTLAMPLSQLVALHLSIDFTPVSLSMDHMLYKALTAPQLASIYLWTDPDMTLNGKKKKKSWKNSR